MHELHASFAVISGLRLFLSSTFRVLFIIVTSQVAARTAPAQCLATCQNFQQSLFHVTPPPTTKVYRLIDQTWLAATAWSCCCCPALHYTGDDVPLMAPLFTQVKVPVIFTSRRMRNLFPVLDSSSPEGAQGSSEGAPGNQWLITEV